MAFGSLSLVGVISTDGRIVLAEAGFTIDHMETGHIQGPNLRPTPIKGLLRYSCCLVNLRSRSPSLQRSY